MLKFAALKFGLDKFSNLVWGFPVKLETDCQALRDVLSNDKLNSAHARWWDGILAHNIIDECHIAGKINIMANGISHMHEGVPRAQGNGSDWTVCEDWETQSGLINNIFQVTDNAAQLREHFTGSRSSWKSSTLYLTSISSQTSTHVGVPSTAQQTTSWKQAACGGCGGMVAHELSHASNASLKRKHAL